MNVSLTSVAVMPGFLIKSWGEGLGMHLPNRVGVASTVVLLWGAIIAIRFAAVKIARRKAQSI